MSLQDLNTKLLLADELRLICNKNSNEMIVTNDGRFITVIRYLHEVCHDIMNEYNLTIDEIGEKVYELKKWSK